MPQPIIVKFMAKKLRAETTPAWRRQLPNAAPEWGACRFEFDPELREYDWLVAYDDLSPVGPEKFSLRKETLACPRERTILVTAEPSSIKCYNRDCGKRSPVSQPPCSACITCTARPVISVTPAARSFRP